MLHDLSLHKKKSHESYRRWDDWYVDSELSHFWSFSSGLVNTQKSSVTLEWNNPKSFRCLHMAKGSKGRRKRDQTSFHPMVAFYSQILWGHLITSLNCQATYIALTAIHSPFNLLRRVPFQPPTSGPFGHGSPESAKTWGAALTWWSSWWSYARPYERDRHRNLWHWKRRSTLHTRHWGFCTRMIVMMVVVLFKKILE